MRKLNWLANDVNLESDTSATFCIPLARVKLVVGLLSFVKEEVHFLTAVTTSIRPNS